MISGWFQEEQFQKEIKVKMQIALARCYALGRMMFCSWQDDVRMAADTTKPKARMKSG